MDFRETMTSQPFILVWCSRNRSSLLVQNVKQEGV